MKSSIHHYSTIPIGLLIVEKNELGEREIKKTPLSIRKIDLSAFHGASLAFAILQRGHGIPHQYSTYPWLLVYISTHWHFSYYYKKPSSTIRLASPRVVSLRGTITSIGLSPYPSSKVLSQGLSGKTCTGFIFLSLFCYSLRYWV